MIERSEWLKRMRETTAAMYDLWSSVFYFETDEDAANSRVEATVRYLKDLLRRIPANSTVLTAGCGEGRYDGMLLDAAGQDMLEFLGNMNALHDRITSTFLNYVPPEFFVEPKGDHTLIHYVSKREGLTPFVVGLLKGLAKRFDCELTILSQTEMQVDSGAHTVFAVEIANA